MKKFEYTYQALETTRPHEFCNRLNVMGQEGWELTGFEYGYAWFKREITPTLPPGSLAGL